MKKLGNVLIEVMQDLSEISTNGSAKVKVNRNLCSPQEFEQLFRYFSRGTLLERLEMDAEPLDTRLECVCGYDETIETDDHAGYDRCPECGQFADIKDDEYRLIEPDPERAGSRQSIRF